MFIVRPIFFIVMLALGFVLSQNLDGILKIREREGVKVDL